LKQFRNYFVTAKTKRSGLLREFTLGPLSESRSAPGGRQLVGKAAILIFESAWRLL